MNRGAPIVSRLAGISEVDKTTYKTSSTKIEMKCTEGTTATASTFSSSTISKLGYTYLATRMLAYMNDNALTYANYISYPGTSGLSYSGLIGFDTGARIIARV